MNPILDRWGRPIRPPRETPWRPSPKVLLKALVTLSLILAPFAAVYWQTQATRDAYSGPWLRFEYFICTGPYNNDTSTFQQLPVHALGATTSSADFERAPRDFVIQNAVFENISLMEPDEEAPDYDRGGPVTTMLLGETELDALTGFGSSDVVKWQMTQGVRSEEEIDHKIAFYFDYLRENRPTVGTMASIGRVPPWVRAVRRSDPSYDEPIDFSITAGPHNDAISGNAYFRSVRTVHVRIENVSPHVLTDLSLRLQRFGIGDGLRAGRDRVSGGMERTAFPLSILRPGEAVVYPLSISLVPHLEVTSLYPGAAARIDESWSQDQLRAGGTTLLSSVGQQEITLQPSLELQGVNFRVEDEPTILEERRGIATQDRLYINNTCECGSCPLLLVRGRDGSWIRTREFLTYADSPQRAARFDIAVPEGIDEVMIAENPGETAYIRGLTVAVEGRGGVEETHVIEAHELTVTVNQPYVVDLTPYRHPGANLRIQGEGYYIVHTDVICPLVFPLPNRWVQDVASAR